LIESGIDLEGRSNSAAQLSGVIEHIDRNLHASRVSDEISRPFSGELQHIVQNGVCVGSGCCQARRPGVTGYSEFKRFHKLTPCFTHYRPERMSVALCPLSGKPAM
jgi:hypothetical protein